MDRIRKKGGFENILYVTKIISLRNCSYLLYERKKSASFILVQWLEGFSFSMIIYRLLVTLSIKSTKVRKIKSTRYTK